MVPSHFYSSTSVVSCGSFCLLEFLVVFLSCDDFYQRQELNTSGSSGSSKDCILLAACEAHETLPQSAEFPADVFTSCLTTPIRMALHWLVYHLLIGTNRLVSILVYILICVEEFLLLLYLVIIQFIS